MLKNLSWPVLSLLLGACVTINIYFPAAAAEEAAREIVRDVLDVKQPGEQKEAPEKAEDDQSAIEQPGIAVRIAGHLVEMLVPEVHAAKADINICLLYTSPSPRDSTSSRMPSSA